MRFKEFITEGYYGPHYDQALKVMKGSQKDFIAMIGATQDDINQAMTEIQNTRSFKQATGLMRFISTNIDKKHGTLTFEQPVLGGYSSDSNYFYKIYANGQIRQFCGKGEKGITRLKTLEPNIKGETPKDILIDIWEAAINEIVKKLLKKK